MHFTICNIFTDSGRHKYPSNYFWNKIWTFGHSVGVWHPYKRLVFIHILATVNVLALPRPRLQCRRGIRKSRWLKEITGPLEPQGFAFILVLPKSGAVWGLFNSIRPSQTLVLVLGWSPFFLLQLVFLINFKKYIFSIFFPCLVSKSFRVNKSKNP